MKTPTESLCKRAVLLSPFWTSTVLAEPSTGSGNASLLYIIANATIIVGILWAAIRQFRQRESPLWKIVLVWGLVCYAALFLVNAGLALALMAIYGATM